LAATPPTRRLVGDIGGTNSRLGLFDSDNQQLSAVRSYTNCEFNGLAEIISAWLGALKEPAPEVACLAVAAPPFEDEVNMLNLDWSFSCKGLARDFGFSALRCVNDFQGTAYALPHLQPGDLQPLRAGATPPAKKLATVGPGTGLGGATLDFWRDTPVASASEPGHMGLAPATPLEFELFRALFPEHGELHAELLVSGPGLGRLYRGLAQVLGETAPERNPGEISALGVQGECALCTRTLDVFCGLLGSVCGDYVLATGSYGGLYLAGGIVPRMLNFIEESTFSARFDTKGEMQGYLRRVPLYAITHPAAGLLGAGHVPL